MEPKRVSPFANQDVDPQNPSHSAAVPADEVEPMTTAELDRDEERAIKNNEHR